MGSAREDVLARIRAAHQAAPPPALAYGEIARDYSQTSDLVVEELRERLVDRLLDYKALVRHSTPDRLAAVVAEALDARGVRRVVVPDGLDQAWLGASGAAQLQDGPGTPLSVADLDGSDGVLTGCTLAVAETGTLILDGRAGQGRRALTLVPDYHLCVVLPESICADVPQAIARLDVARPVTMISGPSATSDIELERVEGVHGPRTLEVIVVTG